MDNKYGRIFTEEDVKKVVVEVLKVCQIDMARSTVDEIIGELEGKFPKDEPLFLLRAKDRLAAGAVRNYEVICQASSRVPQGHLDLVGRSYRDFDSYRLDHEVEYPD